MRTIDTSLRPRHLRSGNRFVALSTFLSLGVACSHQQASPISARVFAVPVSTIGQPGDPSPPLEQPPATSADTSKDRGTPSIFFDFDSALLRQEAQPVLQKVASTVSRQSTAKVRIEGNCDQMGTVEYNLALGEQRARAAQDYLVHMGVPRDHIATISFGSQHPKYPGSNDEDRAKNRRDDIVVNR